ncbi:endonuclease 8-like 2 [Suncus etruscus]|uniref:endonuclease 8-like 2 n=1 Tax=Suncus etruscus TaxID=109475 RepID=UPI0021109DE6|nr:endonuclease 8-like 2 [Suncus etruscus]
MPEGPSVRMFHQRVLPFVGQRVASAVGTTKKLEPATLQALRMADTQVHGKMLFLRFDPGEETGGPSQPEPLRSQAQQERPGSQEGPSGRPQTSEPAARGGVDGTAEGADRWLQVRFGLFGSVRSNSFSRATKANKRGDWRDPAPRLLLRFEGGGFLTFYNCQLAWSLGPVGTVASDILSPKFHRGQALEALGQARPVCYTLMDQRCFSGLGNIIKNEALYRAGVHPLSPGSLLGSARLEALLDEVLAFSKGWLHAKAQGRRQCTLVYGKDHCPAGHLVRREALGPPGGWPRLTWWCPQCQSQWTAEKGSSQPPLVPAEEPFATAGCSTGSWWKGTDAHSVTFEEPVSTLALQGPQDPGGRDAAPPSYWLASLPLSNEPRGAVVTPDIRRRRLVTPRESKRRAGRRGVGGASRRPRPTISQST